MYIFTNLLFYMSSLICYFLKKKSEYNLSFLEFIWKFIFEKMLEFSLEFKTNFFQQLKNNKKFLKIFKRIKKKLLLYISTNNCINIIKFSQTKQNNKDYLHINFFNKKLFWLNLKEFYTFKERPIICNLNRIPFMEQIKCILCSNITIVYNHVEVLDFYKSCFIKNLKKKISFNFKYLSLIVYDHLCIFCKKKTNTEHKLYFLKIPLNLYSFIISSEENFFFFYSKLLFFINLSRLINLYKTKKIFSNKLRFKQIYLFFLNIISSKCLIHSYFKKKFTFLKLGYCLNLKIFIHTGYSSQKLLINKKKKNSFIECDTNTYNTINNKKNFIRNKILLDTLNRLKRIKKYNYIKNKFFLGKAKSIELFLNDIKQQ
jgi:hypothetical protein